MRLIHLPTKLLTQLLLHLGGEPVRRRRYARRLAKQALQEYTRLGFTSRNKKGKKQKVRFESPLLLTSEELYCPLDLRRLPTGTTTNDLRTEDVLKSLEDRCHAPARIDTLPNGKVCLVFRVRGAAFPEIMAINRFKLPEEAPPLAVPIGVDGTGEHTYRDLVELPHLLVVGSTGNGKSNFLHILLTTLITRNSAEDLELWLADHKGGAELNRYKALMGSRQQPSIVRRFSYQPVDTVAMLEAALKEIERRLELLRKADASDLADYQRQTGTYLRRIVIVIDEIFFLMLNKEPADSAPTGQKFTIAKWAEHLFAKIASTGRAPGVHLVIATQKTGKDVLTSLITANFESRLVFSLADMYQSIYVLQKADAAGLPRGRAIFRSEDGGLLELQTPRITPDQTRLTISRVSRYGPDGGLGHADEQRRFLNDAKVLLTVACEQLGGIISRAILDHRDIRGVITRQRYDEICKRLERDSIIASGRGRAPRRVNPAFMGRIELLDLVYGSAAPLLGNPFLPAMNAGQSATSSKTPRRDEERGVDLDLPGAGCGIRTDGDRAGDLSIDDLPPALRRFFDDPEAA